MPPIHQYSSRKEWEIAYWKNILQSKDLLDRLTTPHERHLLIMRAAVLDRIDVGKSYRKIGEELWISSQTVSGIKKTLGGNRYQSYRQQSKTKIKKKTYSSNTYGSARRKNGKPVKTKYGTVYLP